MKSILWAIDKTLGRKIYRQAQRHVAQLAAKPADASRARTASLITKLSAKPGPQVAFGKTEWGQRVSLPLELLVRAHSIITGGTGSGKTMASLLLIDALLHSPECSPPFGVLDAKGELFERVLFLLGRRMEELPQGEAERLKERIMIVDLSSQEPVSSYNITNPWSEGDLDFFVTSRVDTLQELLPTGDGFSLRGGSIVKHVLKLLAEHSLPFSYFDRALSSEPFRADLLSRSEDADLRSYFRSQFPGESRSAIAAVRARITSSLLGSASLKLALSGRDAPDFRRLMDESQLVLINCAGPNIPRSTARTLQALFLSDIRHAVFARRERKPYLWVCDEAQNFFRTRQQRENMQDILTMSRTFQAFFLCLTQNLGVAVQDGNMIESLYTNIRWSLTLRGTPRDGEFLRPALPITGNIQKPRANPYAPAQAYSPSEERALLIGGLAHLPDRTGWLWLKSLTGEAMKIRTKTLELPEDGEFHGIVERLRADAGIGHRTPRAAYVAEIRSRDAAYESVEEASSIETFKQAYREGQEVVQ